MTTIRKDRIAILSASPCELRDIAFTLHLAQRHEKQANQFNLQGIHA